MAFKPLPGLGLPDPNNVTDRINQLARTHAGQPGGIPQGVQPPAPVPVEEPQQPMEEPLVEQYQSTPEPTRPAAMTGFAVIDLQRCVVVADNGEEFPFHEANVPNFNAFCLQTVMEMRNKELGELAEGLPLPPRQEEGPKPAPAPRKTAKKTTARKKS